jgi:hypothetical protein
MSKFVQMEESLIYLTLQDMSMEFTGSLLFIFLKFINDENILKIKNTTST